MKKRNTAAVLVFLSIVATHRAGGEIGDGVHLGSWALYPFADVSGVYDSDVDQSGPLGDDFFWENTVGLRVGYDSYNIDFSGLGFLSRRDYQDYSDKDFNACGDLLKLQYGNRDQLTIEGDQSFRKVEDIDRYGSEAAIGGISPDSVLDATARSRRAINQLGISFGKNLTDRTDLDIGYRFDAVDFEDSALSDPSSQMVQVESSAAITDKTALFGTTKAGFMDSDQLTDAADYYAVRLGLKTRSTDKVSIKAGAGVQQFNGPNQNGDTLAFNYDLVGTWMVTDQSLVQMGARNGTTLSSIYAKNAADYDMFWVGVVWKPTQPIAASLNFTYRQDQYLDPVPVGHQEINREDTGYGTQVRIEYLTPTRFLRLIADASYETVDSNVLGYEEARIGVGASLQY